MWFLETPSHFDRFRRGESQIGYEIYFFSMIGYLKSLHFVMGFLETPSLSNLKLSVLKCDWFPLDL